MARLVFNAEDVRRVVEHSIGRPQSGKVVSYGSAPDFKAITAPVTDDAVLLVHDDGVYLMSNAKERDPLDPTKPEGRSFVAYAKGCNPTKDADHWDNARDLVGGDDFRQELPWAKAIKAQLDAGKKQIVINFGVRSVSLGR